MKKGSILRYLLSSACILSLIGTGFAVWQFENSYQIYKSFELKANVAAFSEEGELNILPLKGYTTFNLILEQADGSYGNIDSSLTFLPNINMVYTNYTLNVGATAYLVGSVSFLNPTLSNYVEAFNPSTNQSIHQVFLEEDITNDLKNEALMDGVYERTITPSFRYIDDRDHIPPSSASGFVKMVNELDDTQEELQLEYAFMINLKIEFRR